MSRAISLSTNFAYEEYYYMLRENYLPTTPRISKVEEVTANL